MNCLHKNARVVDSRERRRRRICLDCHERFTTYEISPEEYEDIRKISRSIKAIKLFAKNLPTVEI